MDVRRCVGVTVEKENRENGEEVTAIRLTALHTCMRLSSMRSVKVILKVKK